MNISRNLRLMILTWSPQEKEKKNEVLYFLVDVCREKREKRTSYLERLTN